MSEYLTLRCPKCKRQKQTPRAPVDPEDATRVEIVCDNCDTGDFSESMYFDKNNNHITRDYVSRPAAG